VSEKELKAVEMYKKDEKVNKICVDMNISMGVLYYYLKKYHVPLRRLKKVDSHQT